MACLFWSPSSKFGLNVTSYILAMCTMRRAQFVWVMISEYIATLTPHGAVCQASQGNGRLAYDLTGKFIRYEQYAN